MGPNPGLRKLLIPVFSMKPFPSLNIPLLEVPETRIQQLLFSFICPLFCKFVWLFSQRIFELSKKDKLCQICCCLYLLHICLIFTLRPTPISFDLFSSQLISCWVIEALWEALGTHRPINPVLCLMESQSPWGRTGHNFSHGITFISEYSKRHWKKTGNLYIFNQRRKHLTSQ